MIAPLPVEYEFSASRDHLVLNCVPPAPLLRAPVWCLDYGRICEPLERISIKCLTRAHQHLSGEVPPHGSLGTASRMLGDLRKFSELLSESEKEAKCADSSVLSSEDNVIICKKVCSVRFTLRECPPSATVSQDSLASPCMTRFFIF